MSALMALVCCAVLEQFTASVGVAKIENFSYRSLSVVHTPQGELTAIAQAHFAAPDKYREDSSMSFGKIVTVRRGDEAWASTPRGLSDLTPDQRQRTVERIYRNYLGLLWGVVDGRVDASELDSGELLLKVEGSELRATFDPDSGHLLEFTTQGANLAGAPVIEKRVFSEFDDETHLPAHVVVYHDDVLAADITVKSWNINEVLDPSLFERPKE